MPSDFNLEESYQLKGEWWLPSDPKNGTIGTLDLKGRDGAFLDLDDRLAVTADFGKLTNHPVVLGVTYTGRDVTLCDCWQERVTIFSSGRSSNLYRVKIVYIGRHFDSEEQIKLSAARVWLFNADEWIDRSGFTLSARTTVENLNIKYSLPEEIPLYDTADSKLSIGFSVRGPKRTPVQKNVELSQEAYLNVLLAGGKNLGDYLRTSSAIQNFLSLAIRGPVYPKKIQVVYRNETRNPIDVYCTIVPRPASRLKLPFEMVFTYPEISAKARSMVNLWLCKWPRLQPICDIYFSTVYGRELYMENKFLGMTQILESFHRRFIKGQYQSVEDYNRDIYPNLVAAIPNGIDPAYQTSLKTRMKFNYEYSLRKRLRDLIERTPKPIIGLLLGTDARASNCFVGQVIDTRNYFTHYTKELESKAARGEELYWLYNKMKILCEMIFFREMGLCLKQIEKFMMSNDEYLQEFERGRGTS